MLGIQIFFKLENGMTFFCFQKSLQILEKEMFIVRLNQTLDTTIGKVTCEVVHQPKLEFYYANRKMENDTRSNLSSIVLLHNFIYFRVQTG